MYSNNPSGSNTNSAQTTNTTSLQQASQLAGLQNIGGTSATHGQSSTFPYQQDALGVNSNAQIKVQKHEERLQEIDRAAKACDSELLQTIIEDAGEDAFNNRDLNRALLQAVKNCSSNKKNEVIECIRILLNAGANVDAQDPDDGKTALMIACEKGYIEVVDCLIQQEAQVNLKDRKSRSSILYAIEANAQNSDVVMQLIKKQADVNVASIDGWSPLLKATQKQYHEILIKLIEKGSNLSQKLSSSNNTALHLACENGDLQAVSILIAAGYQEFENLNKDKETPIMIAERNQSKGQQYQQTYNYLKHIMDERENKASQVKDELVKQEEIQKEKETKRISKLEKQKKDQKNQQQQQHSQQHLREGHSLLQNDNNQSQSTPSKSQHSLQGQSLSARLNPSPKIDEQQQMLQKNSSPVKNDTQTIPQQNMASPQQQMNQIDYYANPNAIQQNLSGSGSKQVEQSLSNSQIMQMSQSISNPSGMAGSPKKNEEQKYVATNQQDILPINNRRSPIAPNNTYQKNNQSQNNVNKKNQQSNNPYHQQVANSRSTQPTNSNNTNSNLGQQQNQQFQTQQHHQATLMGIQIPTNQAQSTQQQEDYQQNSSRMPLNQSQQQPKSGQAAGQTTMNTQQQQQMHGKTQSQSQIITNQQQIMINNTQIQSNSQGLPNYNMNQNNNRNSSNQQTFKKNQSLPYQTLGNQPNHSPLMNPQQQNSNQRYPPNPIINLTSTQQISNTQLLMSGLPQQLGAPQNLGYLPLPGMMQQMPPGNANLQNIPGNQANLAGGTGQANHSPIIGGSNQQLQANSSSGNAQNQQQLKNSSLNQSQLQGSANNISNQNNPTNMMPNQQHSMIFPQQYSNSPNFQHQLGIITQQQTPLTQSSHGQQLYNPLLQSMPLGGGVTSGSASTGLPLQNQTNFQNQPSNQNSGALGNMGMSGTSTRSVVQQQPQRQLPIRDSLDLNDEKDQRYFIINAAKLKAEKKYKNQVKYSQNLEEQLQSLKMLVTDQNQKLEDADKDIQQRINAQKILELQNYSYLQERNLLENQLKSMHDSAKIQTDKAGQLKLNMEMALIQVLTQQQSLCKIIQSKYETQALLEESDFQDAQKLLKESQEQLHKFLIEEKNQLSQFNSSPQGYSGQGGAPSALVDKQQSRPNILMKMIERYESYSYTLQDTKDHQMRLHEEILLFRESNITSVIQKALPNSEVKVYGSHATKLCLPWSDIDLVIKTNSTDHYSTPKHVLSIITRELQSDHTTKWIQEVKFVENASVPVVKVKCQIDHIMQTSGLASQNISKYQTFLEQPFSIDITQLTDNHNGLECVKLVQEFLSENEVIEPLILVLKQYLKVCQYNDPYFGGISSYALFLMIVSYLQSIQAPKLISQVNLGHILISFFQFYGDFQYQSYGIYTHLPGKISEKTNHYAIVNFLTQTVQIDDPLHVHNNVGKSSFKFYEIKDSFKFTGVAAYTGCFCDQHHEKYNIEKTRQAIFETLSTTSQIFNRGGGMGMHGVQDYSGSGMVMQQQQQYGQNMMHRRCLGGCDSILSKIIYSYMQYLMHNQ
eukprot:403338429